jgi:HK97 family phage prohead protease
MRLENMETREVTRKASPFVTREENGDRYLEGYFARFDDIYDMGWGITESIDPHAFDDTLGDDVRVLVNHDSTLVLGRTTADTAWIRVDDVGLWVRVKINPDDSDAMNAYARNARGDVSGASFGFDIKEIKRDYDISKGTVHRTLMKVKLYEVSVCTFPAYEKTDVGAREKTKIAAAEENRIWREKQKERINKWH